MKPGYCVNAVGTGYGLCFRKAGKMKKKGGEKKRHLGATSGAAENFTVGLDEMCKVYRWENDILHSSWRK